MDRVSRVLLAVALIGAVSIQTAQAQVRTQPPVRSLVVPQQDQQQNQIQNQAAAQTQIFTAPSIRNVRLDWCAHFGRDCGQVAADLFCREMQFERATRFAIDQNIGARGVDTLVFGDGALCHAPQCSGFRSITCQKTAIATQQAPARVPPLQKQQPTQRQPPPVVQQEEQPVITEEEVPPLPPTRQKPPVVVAQLPPLKIAPITLDVIELLKMGDIYLDDPRVEPQFHGEIGNPFAGDVPVWDDETVFKWHPSNPGMADTYDLRFFNTEAGVSRSAQSNFPAARTSTGRVSSFSTRSSVTSDSTARSSIPTSTLRRAIFFGRWPAIAATARAVLLKTPLPAARSSMRRLRYPNGGQSAPLTSRMATVPAVATDRLNSIPRISSCKIPMQRPRNARRASTTSTTASGYSGISHWRHRPMRRIRKKSWRRRSQASSLTSPLGSISSTIYSSTGATARSIR